jgi:hypothetical protein
MPQISIYSDSSYINLVDLVPLGKKSEKKSARKMTRRRFCEGGPPTTISIQFDKKLFQPHYSALNLLEEGAWKYPLKDEFILTLVIQRLRNAKVELRNNFLITFR